MRRMFPIAVLSAAAVVLLGGCSIQYDYEIRLVVTNAETGEPLEGVTGLIDEFGGDGRDNLECGTPLSGRTNAEGRLAHDFSTSWRPKGEGCLKLHKVGFLPVVVDIPADTRSNPKPRERYVLPVAAQMKPRRVDPNGANPEHERR